METFLLIVTVVILMAAASTIAWFIGWLGGQLKTNNQLAKQLSEKDRLIEQQNTEIISLCNNFTTLEREFATTFVENEKLKTERSELLIQLQPGVIYEER